MYKMLKYKMRHYNEYVFLAALMLLLPVTVVLLLIKKGRK